MVELVRALPLSSARRLLMLGAGGHSRVVASSVLRQHPSMDILVFDDDEAKLGQRWFGEIFVKASTEISAFLHEDACAVHVGIGHNGARLALVSRWGFAGNDFWCRIVDDAAMVATDAVIGRGAFVAARAVISVGSRVGDGAIVNHGAIVDHDVQVGAFAHIAPGAVLGGAATVGARALVGASVVVLPGVRVGADAVVGAGAVVVRDVETGQTVVGNPARPLLIGSKSTARHLGLGLMVEPPL